MWPHVVPLQAANSLIVSATLLVNREINRNCRKNNAHPIPLLAHIDVVKECVAVNP
jgi:hypothetical protein